MSGVLGTTAAWRGLLALRPTGAAGRAGLHLDGAPAAPDDAPVTVDDDGAVDGPVDAGARALLTLLAPFALAPPGRPTVFAQLAQTLDGFLATRSGESRFISGEANLVHLHRLRALADVVVVGRGTAISDDPRLTVRRVEGPNPARAVIDLQGKLPSTARLLADDGARVILLRRGAGPPLACSRAQEVERLAVPCDDGGASPRALVAALADAGLPRILVEGGGRTVSRFVHEGAVDRLHLALAPMFLGEGRRGLGLPAVARLANAYRPRVRVVPMAPDTLYECRFERAP